MFTTLVKHFNQSFLVIVLVGLIIGLTKFSALTDVDLLTALFSVFYVFLRIKTFLDDYSYIETAEKSNPHFKLGFVLAIISWIVWALGGYNIAQTSSMISFFLLGLAITISTVWIIADGLRIGAYKEQYYWIGFNALYVAGLWTMHGFRAAMPYPFQCAIMTVLLVVLVVDFVKSKSFKNIEKY